MWRIREREEREEKRERRVQRKGRCVVTGAFSLFPPSLCRLLLSVLCGPRGGRARRLPWLITALRRCGEEEGEEGGEEAITEGEEETSQ